MYDCEESCNISFYYWEYLSVTVEHKQLQFMNGKGTVKTTYSGLFVLLLGVFVFV